MRLRPVLPGLWLLVACAALHAQPATPAAPPTHAACPKPAEMSHLHLYGLWRAEFDNAAVPPATLLFEKHPDYPESVRGGINRDGLKGLVAGDVENGEFALDESTDGIKIAATWVGNVVENSCGKEIRGTWTAAVGKPEYSFVLRKVPGWR